MNRREFLKRGLEGIVVGSIPFISNCSKNPVNSNINSNIGDGVNIYFLEDDNLTFHDVKEQSLSDLKIKSEPWISSDDILFYDWSAHLVYLKNEKPLSYKDVHLRGKPFIATANGERCYLGAIRSIISSYNFEDYPLITVIGINTDSYKIYISNNFLYYSMGALVQDRRNDLSIKEALIENNQFHAGLRCTLDNVEVFSKDNTSSVRYTYTLYNIDEDNLYVLDPVKMENSLFHYFSNGVRLLGTNLILYYTSENKITTPPEPGSDWLSWHTRIESGKSLTRTVLTDGYPQILPGKYYCDFIFPSLFFEVKDNYQLTDGRIWIGEIKPEVLITDV